LDRVFGERVDTFSLMTLASTPMTEASPDVLERLRADTRSLHESVEKRVDLLHRCATKEAYRGLLVQMFGLHAAIETVLSRLDWSAAGIDLARRRKTHLIRADLTFLDGAEAEEKAQPPLVGDCVPEARTLAEGFGCLYVVEGSTLGGQVILQQLKKTLNMGQGNGASFFASYGREVGSMWRAFGEAAKSHCTTESRIREAVGAAITTFQAFEVGIRAAS
jgi:heme oxygenase (biliverdin-IX-beta and delta-forming)